MFHRCIAVLSLWAALSLCLAASAPKPIALDFEDGQPNQPPAGFTAAVTSGPAGMWIIQQDPASPAGPRVLAQTSTDPTNGRYPLCIYNDFSARDVEVSVRFKAVSGKIDQAAGLVARYRDKDNYYIVRANALEDNIRVYKVEQGKRKQFADANLKVTANEWHTLKFAVKGTKFQVFYDGKSIIEAEDDTFKDAGRVGLWTKADSVTYFDDLRITHIQP